MALHDDNGDPVEGALTPEQAKELQDKVIAADAVTAKAAELEAQLKEKEEQLSKLNKKDFDYGRLRDKTDTEIDEMKKKLSEKDKMILDSALRFEAKEKAEFNEARRELLDALSGNDENKRKAIEAAEKDVVGDPKTKEELEDKLRKASILALGEAPKRNPIFSGYSSSYREPNETKTRFTDTDQGKASLKGWFGDKMATKILGQEKKS